MFQRTQAEYGEKGLKNSLALDQKELADSKGSSNHGGHGELKQDSPDPGSSLACQASHKRVRSRAGERMFAPLAKHQQAFSKQLPMGILGDRLRELVPRHQMQSPSSRQMLCAESEELEPRGHKLP